MESVKLDDKGEFAPDWVGVPEIVPPDDSVKPGGSPPGDDHVKGGVNEPPVTVNVVGV